MFLLGVTARAGGRTRLFGFFTFWRYDHTCNWWFFRKTGFFFFRVLQPHFKELWSFVYVWGLGLRRWFCFCDMKQQCLFSFRFLGLIFTWLLFLIGFWELDLWFKLLLRYFCVHSRLLFSEIKIVHWFRSNRFDQSILYIDFKSLLRTCPRILSNFGIFSIAWNSADWRWSSSKFVFAFIF